MIKMKHTRKPTHPGEVLFEDVLKPLNISVPDAAENLGVNKKTVYELISGKTSLSPVMAYRIAKATNTSPESWMNMQMKLDLWKVSNNSSIKRITRFPRRKKVAELT
jgi:addiction module HigA family antidote